MRPGAPLVLSELAKVVLHGIDVAAHEYAGSVSRKVDGRFSAQRPVKNLMLQVGVCLESNSHRCAGRRLRASSSRRWRSGSMGLALRSNWSHFRSSSTR
jgi:hypothetical protein